VRIVYDGTPLLMRSAGVKNYHYALLTRLLPAIHPHTIELFPFLPGLGRLRNEHSNYSRPATILRLAAVLSDNYLRLPLGSWAARRADLFHLTHHLLHPPERGALRLTSLVHDPTCVLMPEFHTPSNVRYFRRFVQEVMPRLSGIIVPSEAVKRDLIEKLHACRERITVIPHGVEERFFQTPRQPARLPQGVPERYILSLGAMEPRKNLTALLEAYQLLPEDLRQAYPLVIAGASGWKNERLQRNLQDRPGVCAIGYIDADLLPMLYARASVFVFPSLYEGFGMPLLEAMAAGAPVVASNVSAIPEVVGEAGLLVDPRSPSEIARAIERVLGDRDLAENLAARGALRARQFTWQKTAAATRSFFECVAGS
jgi:glycosyltransferase involved in cell wall biosynthesis